MEVKYAVIKEGAYIIDSVDTDILSDELEMGFYEEECINKENNLYVEYGCESFCPTDMTDWQYIIKKDNDGNIISLSVNDMQYVEKYHRAIFQVYCWYTVEAIMRFVQWGDTINFSSDTDDKNISEIENGYQTLYERYKK